jgi:hypothetical protein
MKSKEEVVTGIKLRCHNLRSYARTQYPVLETSTVVSNRSWRRSPTLLNISCACMHLYIIIIVLDMRRTLSIC